MKRLFKNKKFKISLLIFIVLLIIGRVMLPYVVKNYLNNQLANLDGYSGKIDDVDIALYRGAYKVKGFELHSDEIKDYPLLTIESTDLSIYWSELFRGAVVGEILLEKPSVYFVTGFQSEKEKKNNYEDIDESGYKEFIQGLMPFSINRLDVVGGDVEYIDVSTSPKVKILIDRINGTVDNLTNTRNYSTDLVANLKATGYAMSSAKVDIKIALNPFDSLGSFKSQISMEKLPLPTLNSFLKGYLSIDAEEGEIDTYSQLEAKGGEVKGYVKPLVYKAKFLAFDGRDKDNNLIENIKDGAAQIGSKIFRNQFRRQLGSKIVFTGTLQQPNVEIFRAVGSFLSNAFIHAIKPELEPELIKNIENK